MEAFVDVALAVEVALVDAVATDVELAFAVAVAEAAVLDLALRGPGNVNSSSATIYGDLTRDRRADAASCQERLWKEYAW